MALPDYVLADGVPSEAIGESILIRLPRSIETLHFSGVAATTFRSLNAHAFSTGVHEQTNQGLAERGIIVPTQRELALGHRSLVRAGGWESE